MEFIEFLNAVEGLRLEGYSTNDRFGVRAGVRMGQGSELQGGPVVSTFHANDFFFIIILNANYSKFRYTKTVQIL